MEAARTPLPMLLALQVLGAGCHTLDISQPIALIPDSTFGTTERTILREAAACWNDEFGTDLRSVPGPQGAGGVPQQVRVGFLDFVCVYAAGRTETTLPVRISICPPAYFWEERYGAMPRDGLLFVVLTHELGHALNVLDHAAGPRAVMSQGGSLDPSGWVHAFDPEDHRMLEDANPGFIPRSRCPSGHVMIHATADPPRCTCN